MDHIRAAAFHPQTQSKIERWHQTMKNCVLLKHYFLPSDLEAQTEAFIKYYNNHRHHNSLGNLTPYDVYFGRVEKILKQREEIKQRMSQILQSKNTQMSQNQLTTDTSENYR